MALTAQILEMARTQGLRIATAESCTAGMIAAALTEVAGSSDVVDRGFVTYSNAAKRDMVGVLQATLDAHGAVSEEIAVEMAQGALAASLAQIAIAVTGLAGPGGSRNKPEGRVCFGLAREGHPTHVETVEFGAIGRSNVRQGTVDHALSMIFDALS